MVTEHKKQENKPSFFVPDLLGQTKTLRKHWLQEVAMVIPAKGNKKYLDQTTGDAQPKSRSKQKGTCCTYGTKNSLLVPSAFYQCSYPNH